MQMEEWRCVFCFNSISYNEIKVIYLAYCMMHILNFSTILTFYWSKSHKKLTVCCVDFTGGPKEV